MENEQLNPILQKLHQVELEIMDEIHRLCIKHHISYFLDSGSALGAVRHGGFIPWDDDIDIGMLRDDYERFLEVAKHELDNRFYLHTNETDPNYLLFFAKIRKNNTQFRVEGDEQYAHHGIWVDIFPFDNISSNPIIAKWEIKVGRMLKRLYGNRVGGMNRLSKLSRMKYYLICWIPINCFRQWFEKFCLRYYGCNTKYVTCFSYKMARQFNLLFPQSAFSSFKPCKFEDRQYFLMSDYETYLRTMYGNYMAFPPKDKRICHINGIVSF